MQNQTNAMITHVIFDCDGTLVNNTNLIPFVLDYVIKNLGIDIHRDDRNDLIRRLQHGRNVSDTMEAMAKTFNTVDTSCLGKLLYEGTEQQNHNLKLMPGVEKLIMHLFKHNIPMAVATGGTVEAYEMRTKKFSYLLKAGNFISHVVCSDEDTEVVDNKPHSDVYLVCAKRFKKPPQSMRNVLVIEDNYDAVQGAITAGMTTLLVPSVGWLEINDQNSNCDLVLQSLNQFQPQLFGLPCF